MSANNYNYYYPPPTPQNAGYNSQHQQQSHHQLQQHQQQSHHQPQSHQQLQHQQHSHHQLQPHQQQSHHQPPLQQQSQPPPPPLPPLQPPPLQPPPPPPPPQHHQWNWNNQNQQYIPNYSRPIPPNFHSPPPNHINNHSQPPPPRLHGYHNAQPGPRHFPGRGSYRFNNNAPFMPQQNWSRASYKRARLDSGDASEPKGKAVKKKKKPLSQNVPSKKDWTIHDAEKALNLEKEYNKRFKNHSLIIKFPDLELNKEIVSSFHEAIENVHFQQPSTARFCFVTLQESADADAVISALNKQKFGHGYLSAEFKKDREDDQNIGPDDIDPLTLYVGNLAQEITKEDMVKTFPGCRRIDIGYAKKMKYTRYAFVTFKNVNDSVEAFKQTHSTEMYSKSLIVRFRRLHGTVGMPGESKPQNPPKTKGDDINSGLEGPVDIDEYSSSQDTRINSCPTSDVSTISDSTSRTPGSINDINTVTIKQEPTSDEEEKKPAIDPNYVSPFVPGPVETRFARHRPKIKNEIKTETKEEPADRGDDRLSPVVIIDLEEDNNIKQEVQHNQQVKEEPIVEDEFDYHSNYHEYVFDDSDDEDDDDILDRATDFDQLYRDMMDHANVINSLKENRPS